MSIRTDTLLASVPKDSRIVEIGPSFNPIAPRSQGWNSASIDHLSREGLVAKYNDHPGVDVSMIEPVDFVWAGGSLSDAVPAEQHGSFDVFLASHVIEHTPDLITFLDAAETLVKADGVVILAIPDKRYCFDYFQQLTTTGQILDAHFNNRWRHTGAIVFDHFAYAATDGGSEAWGQRPTEGLRLIHGLEGSLQNYRVFRDSPTYEDLHAWHFVPPSFELLLLELARLGETDWMVERVSPTAGWEFFAWLRRGARQHVAAMPADELASRRSELLKLTLLEAQAQIDWLLAGEPALNAHAVLADRATPKAAEPAASALKKSQTENLQLQDRLFASEQRVAAIEKSTSWRATAPLRGILNRMRRSKSATARLGR